MLQTLFLMKHVKLKHPGITAGEWFRTEISATIGSGKWAVSISRQDGTKKEFPNIPCKASWEKSGYLLWAAIGKTDASFFIDNLSMENELE